jgi:hypothetical protein
MDCLLLLCRERLALLALQLLVLLPHLLLALALLHQLLVP